MIEADYALALTAGMVATVNPCGFAMLPAYLSYFLGTDEGDGDDPQRSLLRAVAVGCAVTLGFLVVFGSVGLAVTHLSLSIERYLPWVTMVIGVGLLGLGVAMLRGFELAVRLPKLDKGGTSQGLWSMFLFGISYAVASLSCTLGPFLGLMGITFSQVSYASGVSLFLMYGLGMGLVLTVLTVAIALTRLSLVHALRRALPYINRVSGALLVVAGAYLAWYGWYEVRVLLWNDTGAEPGPVAWVTRWSADISTWVQNTGATRVALLLGIVICASVLLAVLWPRRVSPTASDSAANAGPDSA